MATGGLSCTLCLSSGLGFILTYVYLIQFFRRWIKMSWVVRVGIGTDLDSLPKWFEQ